LADHPHDEHHHHHDMTDHAHDHYEHDHEHDHGQDDGWGQRIASALHLPGSGHSHGTLAGEQALVETSEGIRTVWLAMIVLLLTSVLQVVIVLLSGSVALLADTLHNIGDGLNSIPLLVAFYLARRAACRRYPYGYGRAEDVAGVFIVLSIVVSAAIVFWESFQKLLDPQPLTNLGWVAAAAVVGFLGNEGVALLQIRVGRRIGSAALVADGLHARTDGLTSLAVLIAVAGSWLGFPIVDPIVGLLIGVVILFITWDAARSIWYRLMDAVEPELLDQAVAVAAATPGVKQVHRVRMRWVGHSLHCEATVAVESQLTAEQVHEISEEVRHTLFHEIDRLAEVVVQIDPWSHRPEAIHQRTLHHEPVPQLLR